MGTTLFLEGLGLDEIYGKLGSGGTTSYLRDGIGSTIGVANAAGAVTVRYSYSPYGETLVTGTDDSAFQYTGRENDKSAGLYYYRFRYYSPQLGRFISEDPISIGGGSNLYAYASGDPVSLRDPYGLWSPGDAINQGVVNAAVGFGDGVYHAITLGIGNLRDVRNVAGIDDGAVNYCSGTYRGGYIAGEIDGGLALSGSLAQKLFGRGGWINSNRYLRIGVGKNDGDKWFRIAGEWVNTETGHIDLIRLGKWP